MNKFKRLVVALWYAFLVMLMPGMAKEIMSESDGYIAKDKQYHRETETIR